MEPYATAAQPGPLNGNRPPVNNGGNASFFNQYKTQILYGVAIVIVIIIAMMMFRRKRSSFYTEGDKKETKTLKTSNKKAIGRKIETKPVEVVGPSPKTSKVPTAKKM
jgi:ATP-dependent Zn protease